MVIDINNELGDERKRFWQIVKEARWDGRVPATRARLRKARSDHNMSKGDFETIYNKAIEIINNTTLARVNANQPCFEPRINYG